MKLKQFLLNVQEIFFGFVLTKSDIHTEVRIEDVKIDSN